MASESDCADDGSGIVRSLTSRRGFLGLLGAGAGAAGLASSQSGPRLLSAGGASADQDRVPVEDILVVLEGERHDADGRAYHGVDMREGSELRIAEGDELAFTTQS